MVDTDIMDTKRQLVIDYIKQKYGEVYNIRTLNFLGVKGAIQRAGQVLNIPPQDVIALSKSVEFFEDIQGHEELVDIAKHFYGLCSGYGCHASAVCIFPSDPIQFCPIEKQGEIYLAAYDYHDLEAMTLLKEDILGLRNLTVIQDTLSSIDESIDIEHLPLNDQKVLQQYATGNTTGIFQVDSAIMKQYAKAMNIDCFDDIVALLALVRPGCLDSGMTKAYIECKNGGEVSVIHPKLQDILGDTYQVLVYQEQLMAIAREIGGYSLGESDGLRKIVGRKELDKIDAAVKEFIDRSVARGIPLSVAQKLGDIIKACGRYIFNKSHATLYGMTSYITAYLKYYYPMQYMCALLNSVIDKQDKSVEYINEAKRMGITIVPPNVKLKNQKWIVQDHSLVVGLTYLKGVGDNINFDAIDSFTNLISTNNSRVVKALVKSGACDCYKKSRGILLASLTNIQDSLNRKQKCLDKINENQQLLGVAINENNEKNTKKYTRQLESWKQKLEEVSVTVNFSTQDYDEVAGEIEILGFSFKKVPLVKNGKLTKVFCKNDKNGREMAWLTLSSQYGEFRCTVFSSSYPKIKGKVIVGESYDFVVSDKGILEEIRIDDKTIQFKSNTQWKKRA